MRARGSSSMQCPERGAAPFGDEPELETAVARERQLIERALAEHAVLAELHVALVQREDRLAQAARVARPDAIGELRIDVRAQVDVVGVGAAPLVPRVLMAHEAREARVARLDLLLHGVDEPARDRAVALAARARVGREPLALEPLADRLEPAAERAPRGAVDQRSAGVGHRDAA